MRIVELNTKLFNWVTIARYLYHVSKIGNQSNYTTVNYTISNWHRQGAPIVELPVLCCPLHVPYTSLTCPLPSILNCKKELSCSRSKGWASYLKGGSKVRVLGQGGACNSDPNGQNEWAFVGYYAVLVKSRSFDLYRGQSHLEARTGLAFIEVAWTWLDQNSILTQKSTRHAKFQFFWSIGGWVVGTPFSENLDFAPPFCN